MMCRITQAIIISMLSGLFIVTGCWVSPSDQDLSERENTEKEGGADLSLPEVSLLYPRNGSVVTGQITITAEATDPSQIACIEFFIDGIRPGNGTKYNDPYECVWQANPLEAETFHSIFARATDTSDNFSYSDTITITVNNSSQNSTTVLLNEDLSQLQIFPADNWWNQDISHAPVDAGSDAIINWFGTGTRLHPDFGQPPYGMPYIGVSGNQQLRTIDFYAYESESDAGAPGYPPGYPIPDAAYLQPNFIEGGDVGGGDSGDRHMIIIDRENNLLFETFGTSWNSNTQQWQAACGAVFDLNSNYRRPEGWTSADAAGLAVFPGLVKYDEVFGSNEIDHAFRFTARASNGYVWPASHEAGSSSGAPPLGMRIRLKESFDISGYSPGIQRILRAMKRYGLILADNGSDLFIQGTMDIRWDSGVLNDAIHSLHAGDFEIILLGWQPAVSGIPSDAQTGGMISDSKEH